MSEKTLSQAGLDQHYRNFFQAQEKDFRASSIARLVSGLIDPDRNVLDLGCGSCVVTSRLLRQDISVVSVDASAEMIDMSRRHLEEAGLNHSQLHHLTVDQCTERFPEGFEQIICLDVIEHIQDDRAALRDLFALLRPGGRLVLSVPAIPQLYGPKDERVGHYRRYRRTELLEKMRGAGFTIERVRSWNLAGAIILWFSLKILRRGVDESFRSSSRTPAQKSVNAVLRRWFLWVENPLRPPFGLTLLIVASKAAASRTAKR